jgi:hemoglobin
MIEELYETIGGNRVVSAAIQSFYDRVLRDETLRHFFDSSDMARLRTGQSMFVSMLLGGRVVYTGRDIAAAHADVRLQGLTDSHYDAFLGHFRAALDEVGVKPEKTQKVMDLLEAKRCTVLQTHQNGAAAT